jgi:hypothetical protein
MLPVEYRLDDVDIFDGKGVDLPILHAKTVHIGQLSAYDWFYIYMPAMIRMMQYFDLVMPKTDILEKKASDIAEAVYIAMLTKEFRKYYLEVLKKIGIIKGKVKDFEKYVTIIQLCDIFALLYKFNTDGLKKKLLYLAGELYQNSKTSATSSSHANSTAGLGKIQLVDKIECKN